MPKRILSVRDIEVDPPAVTNSSRPDRESNDGNTTAKTKKINAAKKMPSKKAKSNLNVINLATTNISQMNNALRIYQDKAFELFDLILGEDDQDRWSSTTIRVWEDNSWSNEHEIQ